MINTDRSNWILESGGLGSCMEKLPHPEAQYFYYIELNMELEFLHTAEQGCMVIA